MNAITSEANMDQVMVFVALHRFFRQHRSAM
jgi:hypothetical protein